jgi:hypothetical protein
LQIPSDETVVHFIQMNLLAKILLRLCANHSALLNQCDVNFFVLQQMFVVTDFRMLSIMPGSPHAILHRTVNIQILTQRTFEIYA